jgi:hypothetical protein
MAPSLSMSEGNHFNLEMSTLLAEESIQLEKRKKRGELSIPSSPMVFGFGVFGLAHTGQ